MCFHKLQFNGGKYYNKLQRERNPLKSTQIKKAINVKKLQQGTKGTILLTHCKFIVSCLVHGKKCSLLGGFCGVFEPYVRFPPPKKKKKINITRFLVNRLSRMPQVTSLHTNVFACQYAKNQHSVHCLSPLLPYSCQAPLKSANCPRLPPFLGNPPPLYIGFSWTPLKVGFFSEPKNIKVLHPQHHLIFQK